MQRSYDKEVVARLKDAKSLRLRKAGRVRCSGSSYELFSASVLSCNSGARNVFLSAGLHGDEPAAVYALLGFLESKAKDYSDKLSFFSLPCINPFGFEHDTRENYNKVDLNRDFGREQPEQEVRMVKRELERNLKSYLFTLDLHEDPSDKPVPGFGLEDCPKDFYMYEISPSKEKSLGRRVLVGLESRGIGIANQEKLYQDLNDGGLVWCQSPEGRNIEHKSQLYEYMQRYTGYSFTTETPTCWPLEKRIDAHLKAIELIIDEMGLKA